MACSELESNCPEYRGSPAPPPTPAPTLCCPFRGVTFKNKRFKDKVTIYFKKEKPHWTAKSDKSTDEHALSRALASGTAGVERQ